MFEKSLYDLIRGLRNHKGNERDFIQNCLRECRTEIRNSDMDLKATALLKLVYLEMFGHDMSWASFNVLEVMSSAKYSQKRVGYLSAVQSFRPDTEVLMLATNLLKKDISSAVIPTISLPLITLPHIITPSLALSLSTDLLPRLAHSNPYIRKKSIVTLYRLALVYPDILRMAWPKIKETLMDDDEDPSVIAAIVNVVCELSWRRPQDFLPLAPRFFELLVDGKNNWMAIKIIKLFATLTPLEPRLIRKLLPPLINLIKMTPAVSLLYECIHGIIEGGLFESSETAGERDEVAELCVDKLRGMIVVDGDPNLKYVALLAFNRIVPSHLDLVSVHQDVLIQCVEDGDVSIRLLALDLVSRIVNQTNLQVVVEQLCNQLQATRQQQATASEYEEQADQENGVGSNVQGEATTDISTDLPDDYRSTLIAKVLEMCSRQTYSNIVDFEWYIDVLLRLVSVLPSIHITGSESPTSATNTDKRQQMSSAIGAELRNVAVRVAAVREYTVQQADLLLTPKTNWAHRLGAATDVLSYAAWIVGEYSSDLADRRTTLDSLLLLMQQPINVDVRCSVIQAIPKVFSSLFSVGRWDFETRAATSLLIARIIHTLEASASSPDLEVQERAVEFLELMKILAEVEPLSNFEGLSEPPAIFKKLPAFFEGFEMNPVAASAQRKVPLPYNLDLSAPIHTNLANLLEEADAESIVAQGMSEMERLYLEKPMPGMPAVAGLGSDTKALSNSGAISDETHSALRTALQKAKRREKSGEDPFYISYDAYNSSPTPEGVETPLGPNLGQEVDVDSIPIMDLDISAQAKIDVRETTQGMKKMPKRPKFEIAQDETLEDDNNTAVTAADRSKRPSVQGSSGRKSKSQRGLLQVDSRGVGSQLLGRLDSAGNYQSDPEQQRLDRDDAEMAKAVAEVERLRLAMQRESERIQVAEGVPSEGMVIRKKKKKSMKQKTQSADADAAGEEGEGSQVPEEHVTVTKKRRKKKTSKARTVGDQGVLGEEPE